MIRASVFFALLLAPAVAAGVGCSIAQKDGDESSGEDLATNPDLVISQIYGGSGAAGAAYSYNFIELFNRGAWSVSLAGKVVQYADANAAFDPAKAFTLPSTTKDLAAGGYFLIEVGPPSSGHTTSDAPSAFVTPDVTIPTGMSLDPANGQVALIRSGQALACGAAAGSCKATLSADYVAYGAVTEDAGVPTGALTAGTSAQRNNHGCADTAVNQADFDTTEAPAPRNSHNALAPCQNETDGGAGAALMVLNEVKLGGQSLTASAWGYAEILCTPKAPLAGYYFAAVAPGAAPIVVDLGVSPTSAVPRTCGSNGLVYIKAATGGDFPQETQSVMISVLPTDPAGVAAAPSSMAFMVIKSPVFIPQGTDFDPDHDGKIDLPTGASVVDGIALGSAPAVLTSVPLLTQAGSQAASRLLGNKTPLAAASWFAGALKGAADSKEYDGTKASANAPKGALLTPGAANFAGTTAPGDKDAGAPAPGDAGAKPPPAADPPPATTAQTKSAPAPAGSAAPAAGAGSVCSVLAPGASTQSTFATAALAFAAASIIRRRRRSI